MHLLLAFLRAELPYFPLGAKIYTSKEAIRAE
jgi:hypothetical protein